MPRAWAGAPGKRWGWHSIQARREPAKELVNWKDALSPTAQRKVLPSGAVSPKDQPPPKRGRADGGPNPTKMPAHAFSATEARPARGSAVSPSRAGPWHAGSAASRMMQARWPPWGFKTYPALAPRTRRARRRAQLAAPL